MLREGLAFTKLVVDLIHDRELEKAAAEIAEAKRRFIAAETDGAHLLVRELNLQIREAKSTIEKIEQAIEGFEAEYRREVEVALLPVLRDYRLTLNSARKCKRAASRAR